MLVAMAGALWQCLLRSSKSKDPQKRGPTMVSTSAIILKYVCPAIGVLIMQTSWIAPWEAVQMATAKGNLGNLNPLPWAFMMDVSIGWCIYGTLVQNYWIFFGNVTGFLLSVYYNLQAIKLQFHSHHSEHFRNSLLEALEASSGTGMDRSDEGTDGVLDYAQLVWGVASLEKIPPAPHEKFVMIVVLLWTTVVSIIGFASRLPKGLASSVVGYLVAVQLVFLFAAPMSTVLKAIKTKSSDTIHRPTMWTSLAKGSFMFAYGLAISDMFIALPNLAGIILCLIQAILSQLLPRTHVQDTCNIKEGDSASNLHKGQNKLQDSYGDISTEEGSGSSSDLAVAIELTNLPEERTGGSSTIRQRPGLSSRRLQYTSRRALMQRMRSVRSVASDMMSKEFMSVTGSTRLIFPDTEPEDIISDLQSQRSIYQRARSERAVGATSAGGLFAVEEGRSSSTGSRELKKAVSVRF